MKTHTLYGLSIALLSICITSCGKSNNRKISNKWTVVSSEQSHTRVNKKGDKDYTTISFTETTISTRSEYTPSVGAVLFKNSSGKVKANDLNIKEDGTWTWNQEWSYEGPQMGMLLNTNTKTIQSGTWSFVGKTKGDDFKKNERIAFNILEKTTTTFQTQDQVLITNQTKNQTYLAGENMLFYTIVGSKNKELQLRLETNYQSTIDGEVSTDQLTQNMTLKEK